VPMGLKMGRSIALSILPRISRCVLQMVDHV